jgi:hypothetical protein
VAGLPPRLEFCFCAWPGFPRAWSFVFCTSTTTALPRVPGGSRNLSTISGLLVGWVQL